VRCKIFLVKGLGTNWGYFCTEIRAFARKTFQCEGLGMQVRSALRWPGLSSMSIVRRRGKMMRKESGDGVVGGGEWNGGREVFGRARYGSMGFMLSQVSESRPGAPGLLRGFSCGAPAGRK
jgi:hypothetical protein